MLFHSNPVNKDIQYYTISSSLKIAMKNLENVLKIKDSEKQQWWLLKNGNPIGCLSTCSFPKASRKCEKFFLDFIEIKEEYRGLGLSKLLVHEVEKIKNETLYSTGENTNDARDRLNFIPLMSHRTSILDSYKKLFVKNWESMEPYRRPVAVNAH